jgi:hypothetical protein
MGDFLSDLRYSFRMLIAVRRLLTAIAALALGIGANTAIFTVVNAVLLKPFTYPEPDRMVQFMNTFPDGNGNAACPVNFNTWRAQTSVFQDVTAYDFGGIRTFLARRQVNPGFDPRNVLTLEMSLTGNQFKKTAGVAQVSHDSLKGPKFSSSSLGRRLWGRLSPGVVCKIR